MKKFLLIILGVSSVAFCEERYDNVSHQENLLRLIHLELITIRAKLDNHLAMQDDIKLILQKMDELIEEQFTPWELGDKVD